MTIVILVAVIAIVSLESFTEPLRNQILPTEDTEMVIGRASMLSQLMSLSTEEERAEILERANKTGLDLILIEESVCKELVGTSSHFDLVDRWTARLFLPDVDLSLGGRWIVIGGRRALAIPVDGQATLVARNLPNVIATDEFVSRLTYYVISFLTLLLFFSFYAARTIAGPIDRIVDELDRTDGVAEERRIPEKGTVEVVKLARALNGMRDRICGMVEMRMRMLRSVSHDLRTPLTRLRLRAERLDDESLRQAMIGDIERIDALVSGTLDYLRIDAQGEAEEQVDIASLLQTVQADFADVGFDVRYEGPDHLVDICRPNSLQRAVTNLCDNGVKFGESVVIFLTSPPGSIQIDVIDDGPGIPAEKHALVMDPFFKLDVARGQNSGEGFGLGLSIVRDIAKAHGGAIEFHNREPHGLIVRLLLPTR